MEDWIVAFPLRRRLEELKLVLKTNSVVDETVFDKQLRIKNVSCMIMVEVLRQRKKVGREDTKDSLQKGFIVLVKQGNAC